MIGAAGWQFQHIFSRVPDAAGTGSPGTLRAVFQYVTVGLSLSRYFRRRSPSAG